MADDLDLSCACGEVRAVLHDVGPNEGSHFTCYCTDCRDFVRWLGQEQDALDAHGGTHVYQTRVGKLAITQGKENLAAVHMTEKPTLRWYATCCNTPFFNTTNAATPAFLSVIGACCDAERRDEVLGPSRGDIFPDEAEPPLEHPRRVSMLKLAVGFVPRMLKDTWGGAWRSSPLFDPESKEPIVSPRRITPAERALLGSD